MLMFYVKKVASRLYFSTTQESLSVLDSHKNLLCFYKSVTCSAVEYGCVVWHHNLTTAQSDQLEALQKCALRIILHPMKLLHNTALVYCEMGSLKLRGAESESESSESGF